jgi:uncharacterized protein (DUF58 family)
VPFRDLWLVAGALLALVGFGAGEPVITGVGFAVIVVGGVARFWNRHLFTGVTFTPTLSESRAFIDEPLRLEVELVNKKILPLPWYEWRMALSDPLRVTGEHLSAAVVPGLSWLSRKGAMGWYEHRKWTFELKASERGYHQVGPTTLRSADLFGVFPGSTEDEHFQKLTVYPRVFRLDELGMPADRPFGEQRGGSRVFEDPLRIAGLREYRPGDPLKRIDWKATARTGELTSRVYEPSATQQLYICLNIDTMEHAWEGYLKDELERAVSTAASVAVWAGQQRYSVGLLANGSFPEADRPIRLRPSRAPDQVTRILEGLAVIQPLTMGDLAGTMLRESSRLPAGSTIVVVASLVPEPLAGVILRLHEEGHRVSVLATTERALDTLPKQIPVRSVGRAFDRMETVS